MNQHIVIAGAGFAGLGMAIQLKRAGIDEFTLLEQAERVGGTWRDNHYPGAACDIESHLYSFSFAPNPGWSRTFAPQSEILAYLEGLVESERLASHLRLGEGVRSATWDERAGLWTVETTRGATLRARVVVSGCGGLSRPALPEIPGLGSFRGQKFHSARWDDAQPFSGKRVAVIGTGASAIQIVPQLAPKVEKLHLYQRTAPWILPKPDHAIPGEERERFGRAPWRQRAVRAAQFWRHELATLAIVRGRDSRLLRLGERVSAKHLARAVADPALRARLTPDYSMGC
jgi:cation diffusion facilitator CzcD-associated flavoprotein CzcO